MRIFACMATSLDGKLGPADADTFVPIGSRHDMENLMLLRKEADGILFGASTFRAWPKIHWGQNRSRVAHHFLMSNSLNLDFQAELFTDSSVPVTIFSKSPNSGTTGQFANHVTVVTTPDGKDQLSFIQNYIARCGVTSLLIEGGGSILHQFTESRLLQELFLTLTPRIIGEKAAPALFGGKVLSKPPRILVQDNRLVGDESYLHLKFYY
jgi:riboflavin biosynthesis pyrimidine reductase